MFDRPQTGQATGQVGTELTYFVTVTGCSSSNKLPSFKVVDGRLPPGTKLFDFAGSTDRSTESPRPPVASRSRSRSRTRPVRPTPRPSRSRSSRPRRRRSPPWRSLAERSASFTAAATGSPAVVSSPIPGPWLPGRFLRPRAAEGGEHHLRNADHGWHVHLHRPRHRRSGRLQRERIVHHYYLSVRPFGDRDGIVSLCGPNPRKMHVAKTPTQSRRP